jgi:uracil-DNA glycosylase family 4
VYPGLSRDEQTAGARHACRVGNAVAEFQVLQQLANEITCCRRCDEQGFSVRHASRMNRGEGREILVIGIEPGNTEMDTGEAFSGLAGKRLMAWLIQAGVGVNRDEILSRAHLTSLCKCNVEDKRLLVRAARNCLPFLQRQVEILCPRLCITLGAQPLRFLFGTDMDLETAVSNTWIESDFGNLFRLLPEGCKIVVLPHSSPVSTWLNSEPHKNLLDAALGRIREILVPCQR